MVWKYGRIFTGCESSFILTATVKMSHFFFLEIQSVNLVSNFYMYSDLCCQIYTKLSFGQTSYLKYLLTLVHYKYCVAVQSHYTSSIKMFGRPCMVLY